MDVTPEEFVERLMSPEVFHEPSDDCTSSELVLQFPPWYDEKKYKSGQKFVMRNLFGLMGNMLVGLITIMSPPGTLSVLVRTRHSSSSFTAFRRYISTFLHIISWLREDFKVGSKMWRSMYILRTRHIKATKVGQTKGYGMVSQGEIALSQIGFIGHPLLYPDLFGFRAIDKDSWDNYNHMWRTIFYMIGIKNKYNMCMGTVEEAREICRIVMKRVYSPLLEFPAENFEHMTAVILEGMWPIFPVLDVKASMYLVRALAGVPGYVYTETDLFEFRRKLTNGELESTVQPMMVGLHETGVRPEFRVEDFYCLKDVPEYKNLNFTERLKYKTITLMLQLNNTSLMKVVFTYFMRLMLFLAEYFPVLSLLRFGLSGWRKVNMFEESEADNTEPLPNKRVREILRQKRWYDDWNPFGKRYFW